MVTLEMRLDMEFSESVWQEQLTKYREIVDYSPLEIFEAELITGQLTYANRAAQQTLGYTREEMQRLKVVDLLADGSKHLFAELQANILVNGIKEAISEYKIKTKTGNVVSTLTNCRISDEADSPKRVYFFCQDLTKSKMLESELWKSQKMEAIGTLAAGVAHDFNNLLMVIQGSVSLLTHNIEEGHPQHCLLKKMDQAVKAGADITRKLIGYAGKGKYHVVTIKLNDLILDCSALISRTRKNVIITPALAQDLWPIQGDREQIAQVLLNLFVNAVEAMPMGGELSIQTRNVPANEIQDTLSYSVPLGYVSLEVSDMGVGMDSATLKRVFDPFFTTKEMGRGTGLGLASVHGIVKNHNGFIDVISEKGTGTTFRVLFPAQPHATIEVEGSKD
jgi:PAS domain S-box-containing protein